MLVVEASKQGGEWNVMGSTPGSAQIMQIPITYCSSLESKNELAANLILTLHQIIFRKVKHLRKNFDAMLTSLAGPVTATVNF